MRPRVGSIFKRKSKKNDGQFTWWARLTYTDPVTGARRDRQRRAASRFDAKELLEKLLEEFDATSGRSLDTEGKTFEDLVTYFEEHYLKPAEYIDGRKVAGVRSIDPVQATLKALREHFGMRRLRGITHADIREYRTKRLTAKTKAKKQRSISTVNRELEKLRRMLNIAQQEGWILKNPMHGGDSLISTADEKKRERILTREEELRLLKACDRPRRGHLRALIICALDTGMRRGEIFSLCWKDVDLENRILNIQAFNTKTMRERQVSITMRLAVELERIWEKSTKQSDERVFGLVDNVKKSFTSARREAGLLDVRFHDLRHTAATRLVGAHLPLAEVGRILGHTQANTTYRYVNANIDTARRAAAALDAFNAESDEDPNQIKDKPPEIIN